jgi:D-arabinose 1-dehydrogenase-like Zn-dependent alcohol dehydrogenase
MGRKINAIVYEEINKVAIRKFELAECAPDQIIAETIYTFVSPGTELRVLGGHYATKEDFPLIPGYSAVAEVVEVGSEVKGFKFGDLVSGRNPIKAVPGIKAM